MAKNTKLTANMFTNIILVSIENDTREELADAVAAKAGLEVYKKRNYTYLAPDFNGTFKADDYRTVFVAYDDRMNDYYWHSEKASILDGKATIVKLNPKMSVEEQTHFIFDAMRDFWGRKLWECLPNRIIGEGLFTKKREE